MSTTDSDQLIEVAQRVIDNVTFTSGLWTVLEVANYFNQRQNRFNRDTKMLLAHQPVAGVNGTAEYDLPDDWIATQRATWTQDGVTSPVTKSSRFEAAKGLTAPTLSDRPIIFDDSSLGTRRVELFPTPTADGSLDVLYACVLEVMAFDGSNDIFDVPDEFVPFVTYGVLADMLSKQGRGMDLARAKYCEERYQEGVLIAGVLLEGIG